MTAAAGPAIRVRSGARTAEPFLVSGTVRGQSVAKAVSSPSEVLEEIVRWCDEDPDATGYWSVNGDYSEPVTIVARFKSGLVRETRRIVHLFRLLPGIPLGDRLTAECGETLPIADTEWLSVGTGMPCESCLGAAAREVGDGSR